MLTVETAIAGQGSVLSSVELLRGEIQSGNLSVAFDHAITCPQAYYVVSPHHNLERPIAKEFREWLLESVS